MRAVHSKGFTLVELMVVIAVAAILAVVAAPSYTALLDRYRVNKAAEDVVSVFRIFADRALELLRDNPNGVRFIFGVLYGPQHELPTALVRKLQNRYVDILFRRVAALRPVEIPPGYWVNLSVYASSAITLLGLLLLWYLMGG